MYVVLAFPCNIYLHRLAMGMAYTAAYLSQKLLVLLNPVAGDGSSLRVFRDRLAAVLKDSGAEYEVLVSERRGHAAEVARGENLVGKRTLSFKLYHINIYWTKKARWRGVVAVGGDGTVREVLGALFDRADWQDALSHLAVCAVPVPRCAAAFARSVAAAQGERFDVMGAAINAARCQVCTVYV